MAGGAVCSKHCLSRVGCCGLRRDFIDLLISEATLNWGRPEFRSELGRFFGHGRMNSACKEKRAEIDDPKRTPPSTRALAVYQHLRRVADTFITVQQRREEADYDTGKEWKGTEVEKQIDAVEEGFESRKAIREEPAARAYLVSLLGKRPRPE